MGIYLNSRRVAFLALLLAIVSLLYSSTLQAPFNYDDEAVIKIETLENAGFFNFYPLRYRHLFYSSLILNYSLGELNPLGYHLVNTSLHFLTSIVIFFIASITIEKGLSLGRKEAFTIASLTALLFSVNPVNSEAVNYISGRASGMCSFFYLSALLFFILGSLRKQKPISSFLLFFSSLACFFAAILSKEIALTCPLVLFLYDICFMRNNYFTSIKNRFLFFYLPLFLCSAFAVFEVSSMKNMISDWSQRIDIEYGLKQIQIIGHGARVILFPVGLTFDYHFPSAFFTTISPLTTLSFFAIGVFSAITLYFTKARPIVFFCISWFLITLAPTNSILPRSDLLSERNLYLPSFGILFLLVVTIYQVVMSSQSQPMVKKIGVSCIAIFFILQIVLLYERNLIYRSNTLLWEDTLKKSPEKLRALHNLSHYYIAEKNYAKAFISLRSLVNSKASPHYIAYAHSNLGSIYLQWGDYSKAESAFKSGIQAKPTLPTNYFNLGTLLASQGRNLEAKKAYQKAETLYKDYQWGYQIPAEFYLNKARLLLNLNLYQDAENSAIQYLDRLGDHIYKNRDLVDGIDLNINTEYEYLPLLESYNGELIKPSLLNGKIIKGNRSGAKARVVNYYSGYKYEGKKDFDADHTWHFLTMKPHAVWIKYLIDDKTTQKVQAIWCDGFNRYGNNPKSQEIIDGETETNGRKITYIRQIPIVENGVGYTTIPNVIITGGGGFGATARATINSGSVTGADVTNTGSGYTSIPSVIISGGGGTGAKCTATLNNSSAFLAEERISTTDRSISFWSKLKSRNLRRSKEAGLGHFMLAKIYTAMGKNKHALFEYTQSGNDPKLKSEAHNNRALIFIKKNSFKRAFEELNQAIIIYPNLIDAHYNLGNLLIQTKGDSIKARQHLEKALKLTRSEEGTNRIKSVLKTLP